MDSPEAADGRTNLRRVPESARNLLAPLVFASLVCGLAVLVRFGFAGTWRFTGLFGNLLLAWIPLLLTLALGWLRSSPRPRRGLFWLCAVAWFLFYPNAFYIVTDIVHVKKYGLDHLPKWVDLMMIMAHAFTGVYLGCLSLHLTEGMVRDRHGHRAATSFAGVMLFLASFGIYLGRFVRMNSWDIVSRPARFMHDLAAPFQPGKIGEAFAFTTSFFFFSVAIYWFAAAAFRHPRGGGAAPAR